jgi:hypothetical protein
VNLAARLMSGVFVVSFSLLGAEGLAGSRACAGCHKSEYAPQTATSMAHAMEPIAACSILAQHKTLSFHAGAYSYRIKRQGDESIYTVSDGAATMTVRLAYAFGLGKAGQTYVFERDGNMYESRVSFYKALDGLDLTMGAANMEPRNLEQAAGRMMSRPEAEQCFGCHTTSVLREAFRTPGALTPGVTCEHCHGSAVAHVEGFRAGQPVAMKKLSALSTEELSDFCGQCHRTWAQIAADGPHNINNVRFQPYRLANSKCYDPSDQRIRCTACHNVHEEVAATPGTYDGKCISCHMAQGKLNAKVCPVGRQDCVSCHMPKLELPGAHDRFTDHDIRIEKVNGPYPP